MFFFLLIALVSAHGIPTDKGEPESGTPQEKYEKGLITINPEKSVYSAGEEAMVYMVVLDEEGKPVSGADVELRVTMPDNSSAPLTVVRAEDDGVYIATYTIPGLGTYRLHAAASFKNSSVRGETTFQAEDAPKFEIIRSAPLKIDPRLGPFTSSIKVIAKHPGQLMLREHLPREFEIINPGGAKIINEENRKILTWLGLENNSEVTYSVKAPLLWPYIFLLGPAEVDSGSEQFVEPRAWMIASDPEAYVYHVHDHVLDKDATQGGGKGHFRSVILVWNPNDVDTSYAVNDTYSVDKVGALEGSNPSGATLIGQNVINWSSPQQITFKNFSVFEYYWYIRQAGGWPTGATVTASAINGGTNTSAYGSIDFPNDNAAYIITQIKDNVSSWNYGVWNVTQGETRNFSVRLASWQCSGELVTSPLPKLTVRLPSDWTLVSYPGWTKSGNDLSRTDMPAGFFDSTCGSGSYSTAWNFTATAPVPSGTTPYVFNTTLQYTDDNPVNHNTTGEHLVQVIADAEPPKWRLQSQSKDEPNVGEEVILSAQGRDDLALSFAWLETNESGVFENKTEANAAYGSPMPMGNVGGTWVWSNFTWSNSSVGGGTGVTWRIWYNDTSGKVNKTDYMNFTVQLVNTPPSWRNQDQNTSTPAEREDVLLYAQGQDENGLAFAWLETNETGADRNYTNESGGFYGSPKPMGGVKTWAWSNFTWSNDSVTKGTTVRWRIWYNDTTGLENKTEWKTFTVQTPSLTIQPSQKDSYINEDEDAINYDGEDLNVTSWSGKSIRSLVQFDLSSMPTGISIDSAALKLYVTDAIPGSTRTYNAHRLTSDWTEGGVTWIYTDGSTLWSTEGGDFVGTYTGSANAGTSTYTWVSWDITEDIRGWYNGSYDNYGTLIKDADETGGKNTINFVSKDNSSDPDLRPRLVVNYSYLPDLTPPMWQKQNQSTDTPNVGEEVILSAQGKDDVALSYAVLETDETGTAENKTGVYGSPMYLGDLTDTWVWSNFTWANGSVSDLTTVQWRIWYNDTSGRWNKTDYKSFTVTKVPGPPKWRYQSQSDDTPYEGAQVILSAQGYDEEDLTFAWLETNESGVWENKTEANAAYGSPMPLGGAGWKWSNFTWQNNSVTEGTHVGWRIWYNDSSNMENGTDPMTFIVQEPRLVIQPSNRDSYIDQSPGQSTKNFGSEPDLMIRSRESRNKRSLVQFDVSSLPQGVSIDSALLDLYMTQAPGTLRNYTAHRVTNSWTESGVTWNSRDGSTNWGTAGGDYVSAPTDLNRTGAQSGIWVAWNITTDVRGWYNGSYDNYGTLIKDKEEDDTSGWQIIFASKEYGTAADRPRLVVKFTPDTTPPQWRSQGWNASSSNLTQINRTVNLSAQGFDDVALNYAWLATNETGAWENKLGVYGSPLLLNEGGQWVWSNFTWRNLNLPIGTHVGWRIYYNDTAGNLNGTDIRAFTLVSWESYCDANFQTPCDDFPKAQGENVYMTGYGYPPNTEFDIHWYNASGFAIYYSFNVKSNASGWLNDTYPIQAGDKVADNYLAVVYPVGSGDVEYDPTNPEIIAEDKFNMVAFPEFAFLVIPFTTSAAIYFWMRRKKRGNT